LAIVNAKSLEKDKAKFRDAGLRVLKFYDCLALQDGDESADVILEGAEDDGTVDLHTGEFCVDVSTYGDIVFESQPREACDTTFEKVCETKTEQVRSFVSRQWCKLVPILKQLVRVYICLR
jgi:hypothetical protein